MIKTLFLDIGGVLLTNGFDRSMRKEATDLFKIDWAEFEDKHKNIYNQHESGLISLDDYLMKSIFLTPQAFTPEEFKHYIFSQSKEYPEMIRLIKEYKKNFSFKVVAISNEGKDLALYRIQKFDLKSIFDAFFVSCFVRIQKPDPKIYQLALDVMQADPSESIYIDDRKECTDAAARFGMKTILHTCPELTKQQIDTLLNKETI